MKGSILVVDDDTAVARVLAALLVQAGHEALTAPSGSAALDLLATRMVDVVITDLRMPGLDGLGLLEQIARRWRDVPVLVLTAHGSISAAVQAMRLGAHDFLTKPFDRDEIVFTVEKALSTARHEQSLPTSSGASDLLGASPAMREVLGLVERAAASTATVLLRGESGTGKEVIARRIHALGPRKDGPFIAIHCGALPDALLESELFGYEKGAFTGATSAKPGRVELAGGGTLFLDEIGDITPALQVKLLRFLQERTVDRLGGTRPREVDVRIVCATHRDLEAMVRAEKFRSDLYYRLNVVPIVLPPLRARAGDVEVLARGFAETFARASGRARLALSQAALARLAAAPWPGNVRQLENFVERLVVLSPGDTIDAGDVDRELARDGGTTAGAGTATTPRPDKPGPSEPGLEDARRAAERTSLFGALERAGGNRTLAARLLGVSRRTLYNKLADHGIA